MGRCCTHTYAVLEVAPESYADIRKRLIEDRPPETRRDYEREYIDEYEGQEVLVLGAVALVADRRTRARIVEAEHVEVAGHP